MTGPRPSGTVERFARIWNRWDDRSPKHKRVARHRTDRKWLDDGVTGLVVRPATAEALAGALRTLPADPIRCRRMGEVGRERAQRLHPPDVHAQRLLQVFARAAA